MHTKTFCINFQLRQNIGYVLFLRVQNLSHNDILKQPETFYTYYGDTLYLYRKYFSKTADINKTKYSWKKN